MVEQSSSRVLSLLSQINGEFEDREANLAKVRVAGLASLLILLPVIQ